MVLQKLHIKNFRGFEDFSTSCLSRFTLIAGENDVGKTSFLEAIFMLSGMMLMDCAARINALRQLDVVKADDMSSVFFAQNVSNAISIDGDFGKGLSRRVELKAVFQKTAKFKPLIDRADTIVNAPLSPAFKQKFQMASYGRVLSSGELLFLSDADGVLKEFTRVNSDEQWHCVFIPARSSSTGVENLKKLIVNKQEGRILQILRRVDCNVNRLVVNGSKVLVDTGLGSLLPIQLLGDGLLKIINTVSAILVCGRGGLICLDEIDNGLHFSAMEMYWDEITRFALEQDVQIIATTHDLSFMKAVTAMSNDDCKSQFSYLHLYRVNRDAKNIVSASGYNYSQYAEAIDSGAEMR